MSYQKPRTSTSPREKLELSGDKPVSQIIKDLTGAQYLTELQRIRGIGWRVLRVEIVGVANYTIVAFPE